MLSEAYRDSGIRADVAAAILYSPRRLHRLPGPHCGPLALTPEGKTVKELHTILYDVERPYYAHEVLAA
jgi:hypothetical protein